MPEPVFTAYLAPEGFEHLLERELKGVTDIYGRLYVAEGGPQKVLWCQNVWLNPRVIPITSVGDAAAKLKTLQRSWWPYSFRHHRRCELIQKALPHVSAKPLHFLQKVPSSPLGSWTLIDEKTVLASPQCSSPMPNGAWNFVEDKENPPSRAYLKLWEFFTRFGVHPTKDDLCLDLGASPGGWTFVLAELAKEVVAFDRSVLSDNVMALPNVSFIKKDAFSVDIGEFKDLRWVFSDVICYPEKLLLFAQKCLEKAPDANFVFTIKLQGDDNSEAIRGFAKLPGDVVHLSQNKHELTWFKVS